MSKIKKQLTLKKSSGLFRKYFTASFIITTSSLIVAGSSLLALVASLWIDENMRSLKDNTGYLVSNTINILESDYIENNDKGVTMICNSLQTVSRATGSDIFIINTSGKVIYCCDRLLNDLNFSIDNCRHSEYNIPVELTNTIIVGNSYSEKFSDMGGSLITKSIVIALPITVNDSVIGAVVSTKSITKGLGVYAITILEMFIAAALIAILVTFIIVYCISLRFTRPLREMSEAAKHYANGDFSVTITPRKRIFFGHDEIDELTEAFNAMAYSLKIQEDTRRSFVTNVSHELKTPMTSIGGFIDGILDGTISGEKREQYLQIVSQEIKRLSRLVTGMLNMSKIEAGELDINPCKFDISEMIFVTLLSFEQTIENNCIDIRGLDSIEPNVVFADKDMINQVIYNLVDNAVKFTPNNGYIEVSSTKDKEKVIIKIKNSGKGIIDSEKEKIFERFYKVDKSRSFDVKGAGMGLYIVKTIIELHGGRIVCQSEPDKYTEFIFSLPL